MESLPNPNPNPSEYRGGPVRSTIGKSLEALLKGESIEDPTLFGRLDFPDTKTNEATVHKSTQADGNKKSRLPPSAEDALSRELRELESRILRRSKEGIPYKPLGAQDTKAQHPARKSQTDRYVAKFEAQSFGTLFLTRALPIFSILLSLASVMLVMVAYWRMISIDQSLELLTSARRHEDYKRYPSTNNNYMYRPRNRGRALSQFHTTDSNKDRPLSDDGQMSLLTILGPLASDEPGGGDNGV